MCLRFSCAIINGHKMSFNLIIEENYFSAIHLRQGHLIVCRSEIVPIKFYGNYENILFRCKKVQLLLHQQHFLLQALHFYTDFNKKYFIKLINFNLPISLQISLSVATALVAYSPKTEHVFQKS